MFLDPLLAALNVATLAILEQGMHACLAKIKKIKDRDVTSSSVLEQKELYDVKLGYMSFLRNMQWYMLSVEKKHNDKNTNA